MATTQTDLADLGTAPQSEVHTPAVDPESGLSAAQAAQRLTEDGPNVLPGGQRRSLLSIAVETHGRIRMGQYANPGARGPGLRIRDTGRGQPGPDSLQPLGHPIAVGYAAHAQQDAVGGGGLAWALLLAALYIPWAVGVLRFAPLPAHELGAACGLGLLSVLWFEGIKWVPRRSRKPQDPGSKNPTQGSTAS